MMAHRRYSKAAGTHENPPVQAVRMSAGPGLGCARELCAGCLSRLKDKLADARRASAILDPRASAPRRTGNYGQAGACPLVRARTPTPQAVAGLASHVLTRTACSVPEQVPINCPYAYLIPLYSCLPSRPGV